MIAVVFNGYDSQARGFKENFSYGSQEIAKHHPEAYEH